MRRFVYVIGFVLLVNMSYSQEANPIIKPEVPDEYSMFKKTVWRRMDLREKQNRPFFSRNREISRLMFEAVDNGLLKPYRSDSCINFMPDIIFVSNISVEQEDNPFVGGGFGGFDSGFGNDDSSSGQQEESGEQEKLLAIPADLFSVIYIREDVIFDRNRSRMYNYIRSISVALPASAGTDWNPAGFEKIVAHFKYEDVSNLFRGPLSEEAVWYNYQNQAAHMNFGDAFELRLFHAPIIKLSNPEDLDIRQEYQDLIAQDPINALIIQKKYDYDLMEFESELWEY
ncbi:MAG: gliding motility protein GldN [Cyclobacteriaceae bacterium]|nr:gliding motility protein GldN [Cyclobacteriaceae bacterium HetDA_MAG_MS6]